MNLRQQIRLRSVEAVRKQKNKAKTVAIIQNFNPKMFFSRKRGEKPVTVEGRWILTDFKWVHTDRVNNITDGGYASFSMYDSEYYMKFSQGFHCLLHVPASAVFEDDTEVMGRYSFNLNKSELSIRLDNQTARFSVLCLTQETMQLYWTDGEKELTMEEFFIFTRK